MALPVKQQALTRPKFDDFHQADDMRITSYAGRYYLNPPGINCYTSFPVDATVRIQASGNSWPQGKWRTEVESDLRGLAYPSARVKCDGVLYNPDTNPMNNTPLQSAPDESFPTVFNKLTNPPCTLRATGWNRWDWLPHNPQANFETPFDHFISARTLDKNRCKTHRGGYN